MEKIRQEKIEEQAKIDHYENESVFEKIEDDGQELLEELEDDVPVKEYDNFVANLVLGTHIFDFKKAFETFRWVFNFVFIFIPYFVISIACFSWNVVLNISFNKLWAGGNLWLVGNTLFLLF